MAENEAVIVVERHSHIRIVGVGDRRPCRSFVFTANILIKNIQ
jgi:hypothetical protein